MSAIGGRQESGNITGMMIAGCGRSQRVTDWRNLRRQLPHAPGSRRSWRREAGPEAPGNREAWFRERQDLAFLQSRANLLSAPKDLAARKGADLEAAW